MKIERICAVCGNVFFTKGKIRPRKTCSSECAKTYNKILIKNYNKRPEVKARLREYRKQPEIKAKRREYMREYRLKPSVRQKQIEYMRKYRKRKKV